MSKSERKENKKGRVNREERHHSSKQSRKIIKLTRQIYNVYILYHAKDAQNINPFSIHRRDAQPPIIAECSQVAITHSNTAQCDSIMSLGQSYAFQA